MRGLLRRRGGTRCYSADDVLIEKVTGGPPLVERQRLEVSASCVKLAHKRADYLVREFKAPTPPFRD